MFKGDPIGARMSFTTARCVRHALAVPNLLLSAMHWRKHVSDALSVRSYEYTSLSQRCTFDLLLGRPICLRRGLGRLDRGPLMVWLVLQENFRAGVQHAQAIGQAHIEADALDSNGFWYESRMS